MSRWLKILVSSALCIAAQPFTPPVRADVLDPFDPFDTQLLDPDEGDDEQKSPVQLMIEAQDLFGKKRLLDGRTKLLKALKKDPKEYRVHLMLCEYYSIHVGHFRLALKYVKEAQRLFESEFGRPPYATAEARKTHAQILYLLSQARLDLDNYPGALEILDEFAAQHYYSPWYPGSRAWVLMKLGRLEEAIKTARLGILTQAEPGRTLNMLGILLSMTGDREQSLRVFKEAVNYELSLGAPDGQPATPLNNAGEVQKENFNDPEAESYWLKATKLPDGCQHVLPSLNLAMLYMDQLNYQAAKETIDRFESCVAQFPLRNGEEHRALVELARGRIELGTGHPEQAVKRLESAIEHTQWFGKIGTSQEDLKVAAAMSLASALNARNNVRSVRLERGIPWLTSIKTRVVSYFRSWWLKRRVRQMLIEMASLEDLTIRNTDSLIEYPRFGDFLSGYPQSVIAKRIGQEEEKDPRPEAKAFYRIYRAAVALEAGDRPQGFKLLEEAEAILRPRYDDGLKLTALLLRIAHSPSRSDSYDSLAGQVYFLSKAALRNNGLPLPVRLSGGDPEIAAKLEQIGFVIRPSEAEYSVKAHRSSNQLSLEFISKQVGSMVRVSGGDSDDIYDKFSDEVFSQELK